MTNRQDETDIRTYLRPLWRRRWLVIVIVVLTTAATYGYYEHEPKDYRAATKVLLGSGANPLESNTGTLSDREVQDLAGLLSSRDVAESVARRLGKPGDGGRLAASIATEALAGSDFVQITASQPNPADAARVANGFAQAFITLRTDAARSQITKSLDALRSQIRQLAPTPRNEEARAQLQDSIRQLELSASVTSGSATQVDPAVAPAAPAGPRPKRDAVVALVVSLIGAIALAYVLQAFDRRPTQLDELAPLYGMPILTSIPHLSTPEFKGGGQLEVAAGFKEPLRQLRTNIQLAALDRPFRSLLVTSAIAGEGKSTVVRNLALVLGEGGQRVAIVEADMRRPTLARVLGQPLEPGLTDVLTGRSTTKDALRELPARNEGVEELARMGAETHGRSGADPSRPDAGTVSLLPAGPEPADPQAILSAERTRQLITELAEEYDVVLIDSPPLLPVTDALALAPWVDGVIVVARLGHVTREGAKRIPEMLRMAGSRPVGLVVNDVPAAEGNSYGYGHTY